MDLLNLSDVIFGESLHTPDMNSRFAKRVQRGSGRMVGKPYLTGLCVVCHQGLGSGQFKYRNLRAGAEPDRKASGADAAIDVKLTASLFVPSADVVCHQTAEVEAAMDEIERQLPAVSVARQSQINGNAELNDVIEHSRVMKQQNVDRFWHHQSFDLLQPAVNVTLPFWASWLVHPDQIKRFAAQSDGYALLAQDADALHREQAGDRLFDFALLLVIPEAAENAVGRAQSGQRTNRLHFRLGIPGNVVPGQHD